MKNLTPRFLACVLSLSFVVEPVCQAASIPAAAAPVASAHAPLFNANALMTTLVWQRVTVSVPSFSIRESAATLMRVALRPRFIAPSLLVTGLGIAARFMSPVMTVASGTVRIAMKAATGPSITSPGLGTVQIRAGETLWGHFGGAWQTIADLNGIADPSRLQVGTIAVPHVDVTALPGIAWPSKALPYETMGDFAARLAQPVFDVIAPVVAHPEWIAAAAVVAAGGLLWARRWAKTPDTMDGKIRRAWRQMAWESFRTNLRTALGAPRMAAHVAFLLFVSILFPSLSPGQAPVVRTTQDLLRQAQAQREALESSRAALKSAQEKAARSPRLTIGGMAVIERNPRLDAVGPTVTFTPPNWLPQANRRLKQATDAIQEQRAAYASAEAARDALRAVAEASERYAIAMATVQELDEALRRANRLAYETELDYKAGTTTAVERDTRDLRPQIERLLSQARAEAAAAKAQRAELAALPMDDSVVFEAGTPETVGDAISSLLQKETDAPGALKSGGIDAVSAYATAAARLQHHKIRWWNRFVPPGFGPLTFSFNFTELGFPPNWIMMWGNLQLPTYEKLDRKAEIQKLAAALDKFRNARTETKAHLEETLARLQSLAAQTDALAAQRATLEGLLASGTMTGERSQTLETLASLVAEQERRQIERKHVEAELLAFGFSKTDVRAAASGEASPLDLAASRTDGLFDAPQQTLMSYARGLRACVVATASGRAPAAPHTSEIASSLARTWQPENKPEETPVDPNALSKDVQALVRVIDQMDRELRAQPAASADAAKAPAPQDDEPVTTPRITVTHAETLAYDPSATASGWNGAPEFLANAVTGTEAVTATIDPDAKKAAAIETQLRAARTRADRESKTIEGNNTAIAGTQAAYERETLKGRLDLIRVERELWARAQEAAGGVSVTAEYAPKLAALDRTIMEMEARVKWLSNHSATGTAAQEPQLPSSFDAAAGVRKVQADFRAYQAAQRLASARGAPIPITSGLQPAIDPGDRSRRVVFSYISVGAKRFWQKLGGVFHRHKPSADEQELAAQTELVALVPGFQEMNRVKRERAIAVTQVENALERLADAQKALADAESVEMEARLRDPDMTEETTLRAAALHATAANDHADASLDVQQALLVQQRADAEFKAWELVFTGRAKEVPGTVLSAEEQTAFAAAYESTWAAAMSDDGDFAVRAANARQRTTELLAKQRGTVVAWAADPFYSPYYLIQDGGTSRTQMYGVNVAPAYDPKALQAAVDAKTAAVAQATAEANAASAAAEAHRQTVRPQVAAQEGLAATLTTLSRQDPAFSPAAGQARKESLAARRASGIASAPQAFAFGDPVVFVRTNDARQAARLLAKDPGVTHKAGPWIFPVPISGVAWWQQTPGSWSRSFGGRVFFGAYDPKTLPGLNRGYKKAAAALRDAQGQNAKLERQDAENRRAQIILGLFEGLDAHRDALDASGREVRMAEQQYERVRLYAAQDAADPADVDHARERLTRGYRAYFALRAATDSLAARLNGLLSSATAETRASLGLSAVVLLTPAPVTLDPIDRQKAVEEGALRRLALTLMNGTKFSAASPSTRQMAAELRAAFVTPFGLNASEIDQLRSLLLATDLRLMPANVSRRAKLDAFREDVAWAARVASFNMRGKGQGPLAPAEIMKRLLADSRLQEQVGRMHSLGDTLMRERWVASTRDWMAWSEEHMTHAGWEKTFERLVTKRSSLPERIRFESAARESGIPLLTLLDRFWAQDESRPGRRPSADVLDARRRMAAGWIELAAFEGALTPDTLDAVIAEGLRRSGDAFVQRGRRAAANPSETANRFLRAVDAQKTRASAAPAAPASAAAPVIAAPAPLAKTDTAVVTRAGGFATALAFATALPPALLGLKVLVLGGVVIALARMLRGPASKPAVPPSPPGRRWFDVSA